MKFVCDQCLTKYAIDDSRVRGKVLKVRCKACQHLITVREPTGSTAIPVGPEAPRPGPPRDRDQTAVTPAPRLPASPGPVATQPASRPSRPSRPARPAGQVDWFVSFDGEQEGPLSTEVARQRVAVEVKAGKEAFAWHAGFTAWLPVDKVAELAPDPAARPPSPPPPPRPRPVTRTATPPAPVARASAAAPPDDEATTPGSAPAAAALAAPIARRSATPRVAAASPATSPAAPRPRTPRGEAPPAPGGGSLFDPARGGTPAPVDASPRSSSSALRAAEPPLRASSPRLRSEPAVAPVARPAEPAPSPSIASALASLTTAPPAAPVGPSLAGPGEPLVRRPPTPLPQPPSPPAKDSLFPLPTGGAGSTAPAFEPASVPVSATMGAPPRRGMVMALVACVAIIVVLAGALGYQMTHKGPEVAVGAITVGDTPPLRPPPEVDDRPVGLIDSAPHARPAAAPAPPAAAPGPVAARGPSGPGRSRPARSAAVKPPEPPRPAPAPPEPPPLSAEQKRLAEMYRDQSKTAPDRVPRAAAAEPAGEQVSNAQIMGVVTRSKKSVQLCFERTLKHDPGLRNLRVDVELNIGISGSVTGVTLADPRIAGSELGVCLKQTIRRWHFPAQDSGYQTAFPLLLQAQ